MAVKKTAVSSVRSVGSFSSRNRSTGPEIPNRAAWFALRRGGLLFGAFTATLFATILPNFSALAGSDKTPPSVPTGLAANATSCNQASLSWLASTDPFVNGQTTSGVNGYNVYRGGVLLKFVTGTSTVDTGLSANSTYSYAVSAVDVAGNESSRSTSTNDLAAVS